MNKLAPDDMSNLFRFFRIPTKLYERWQDYTMAHESTMGVTLAELLTQVSSQVFVPPYESLGYIDIAKDWSRTQPQMYKKKEIKQFHLKYNEKLQKEIFNIFKLTTFQNQTPEMNKEICARLDYALKLNNY